MTSQPADGGGDPSESPQWLFVYYKVPDEAVSRYWAAALRLQRSTSAAHPQSSARIMRRPGQSQGQVTLMEMYGPLPQPEIKALQDTLQLALATDPLWSGLHRHTEWFVESTCA